MLLGDAWGLARMMDRFEFTVVVYELELEVCCAGRDVDVVVRLLFIVTVLSPRAETAFRIVDLEIDPLHRLDRGRLAEHAENRLKLDKD